MAAGDAVIGDLFRCSLCDGVHLDVAAPILDTAGRPVAVLVQRIDAEATLFPLVQSWPLPSHASPT